MRKKTLIVIMVCLLGMLAIACGAPTNTEEKPEGELVSDSLMADNSEAIEVNDSESVETTNPFAELEPDYSVQIPIYVVSHYSISSSGSKSGTDRYFADHVFDEEGHLLSYKRSENERRWDAFTNEYDEQGNVVRLIQDNANSSLSDVTEYEYDERGNCIKETTIAVEDPSDVNTNSYEYDENGFVIKSVNEQSGRVTEYHYEFDDAGKVVKVSKYRDGVLQVEDEYEYDAANKISKAIETNYNDDGSKKSIYEGEVETDPYGHIVREKVEQTYSDDGKKSTVDRKMYYVVGGYKTINTTDMDEISSSAEWIPITEGVAIPSPDSVIPNFFKKAEDSGENDYTYTLDAGIFDVDCYDYLDRCYTDRLANTVQKTPNEAFWIYTGVLRQVLGYEVDELDNGKYVVSIDGFPAAEMHYESVEGNYYLTISLS